MKPLTDPSQIKPDTLEKLFQAVEGFQKIEMCSVETAEILLNLLSCVGDEETIDGMYSAFFKQAWQMQALEKRIDHCLTVKIDKLTRILILYLTECNIGTMITYAYYLQYWASKHNKPAVITLDILCSRIFPDGFFAEDTLHKFWVSQKVKGNNILDNSVAAKSIQF